LTNDGLRDREIEITSYAEIVLATFAADIAHPVFSNLFVQTEYYAKCAALSHSVASVRPATRQSGRPM